jgi:hypothetical protein
MQNHKLSKNVCLEKIHSADQQITMTQIYPTVITYMVTIIHKHTTKTYEEF